MALNTNFEEIENFVNDENKIVTYKWLSLTLGIQVNETKKLLADYVKDQREKFDKEDIRVTYLVSGIKKENGNVSHHASVVKEEDLDVFKSRLQNIRGCHVYSIQKSKIKDCNAIYMVDYEAIKEQIFNSNRYSAITCKTAVPRSVDDVNKIRNKNYSVTSSDIPSTSSAKSKVNEPPVSNPSTSSSNKGTSSKGKGISGMFGSASSKPKVQNREDNAPEAKESKKENEKPKEQKSNFFGKSTNNSENVNSKKEEEIKKTEPKKIEKTSKRNSNSKNNKNKNDKRRKNSKKDSDDDEDPLPDKKRRRIKQMSWESSSSEEEDMDESPIPPSPPPAPYVPTPTPPPSPPKRQPTPPPKAKEAEKKPNEGGDNNKVKRRRRKRKLVSKTTIDDAGMMVTEKVWESESCTDSEPEPEKPKPAKPSGKIKPDAKKSKKKSPDAKANKQTSLMSFFGKK